MATFPDTLKYFDGSNEMVGAAMLIANHLKILVGVLEEVRDEVKNLSEAIKQENTVVEIVKDEQRPGITVDPGNNLVINTNNGDVDIISVPKDEQNPEYMLVIKPENIEKPANAVGCYCEPKDALVIKPENIEKPKEEKGDA